ncbi:MAG: hypothetical protein K8F91_06260 [Candidatus Obscuribacterales bacterium]|nr:hypothetical protein [Candidatus Obscuribacterales bacterium]
MSTPQSIANSGIIEQIVLPEGFSPPCEVARQVNGYLEFHARGAGAIICYEQSSESFSSENISIMEKTLQEDLGDSNVRQLNFSAASGSGPDDSLIFDVLCFCFVFGGALTRSGTMMDMDRCQWELRAVECDTDTRTRTLIVGRLKFTEPTGRRSQREVLLVMPQAPSEHGCGYLWLEGTASDIKRFEKNFLACVAQGKYRNLTAVAQLD